MGPPALPRPVGASPHCYTAIHWPHVGWLTADEPLY